MGYLGVQYPDALDVNIFVEPGTNNKSYNHCIHRFHR